MIRGRKGQRSNKFKLDLDIATVRPGQESESDREREGDIDRWIRRGRVDLVDLAMAMGGNTRTDVGGWMSEVGCWMIDVVSDVRGSMLDGGQSKTNNKCIERAGAEDEDIQRRVMVQGRPEGSVGLGRVPLNLN
jgi:hypothetical protein